MQRIPLTSDAVTFHGRIVPEGEGLWLGWTNTGISFRFEGRHVAFRFALPRRGRYHMWVSWWMRNPAGCCRWRKGA